MKARMESERGSGTEWLEVHLSAGDRLDLERLAWLRSRPHRYLLELEGGEEGRPVLRYNVTGLESLRSFMRSYEITSLQYENILVSLGEVVGMLRHEGQDPLCLDLDERFVFADIDGNLWFVLLPVALDGRHQERGKGRDPLWAFLDRLSRSRHIAYSSADDLALAGRLRKVVRADGFSFADYESFLVREYGIRLDFSDTAGAVGPQPRGGWPMASRGTDSSVTSVAPVASQASRAVTPNPWTAGARVGGGGRTTTFRLVLLDGSNGNYALGDCRTVLVGRGSGCDVRITGNMSISRIHARIERDGQGFRVTDLGSANGTIVRGMELHEGESEHVGLGETFELADVPMAIEAA